LPPHLLVFWSARSCCQPWCGGTLAVASGVPWTTLSRCAFRPVRPLGRGSCVVRAQTQGDSAANAPRGIIELSELTETAVPVTLDEDIYNAVAITDEQLTLDIAQFGEQVLVPQIRAVAEGLENKLAETMVGADYVYELDLSENEDPYETFIEARKLLNMANVPTNDRIAVVGAEIEALILKSKHLSEADKAGDNSALRDAVIGRYAGLPRVYVSNALPSDVGFIFHRTAYVMSLQAPIVPPSVVDGSTQTYAGLAMRWIRDYDAMQLQERSIVDCYVGTNIVADGPVDEVTEKPTFVRAVKLTLGEGSSSASASERQRQRERQRQLERLIAI